MPNRNPVMTSSRVVNHAIGLAPARRGLAAGTSGMRCRRHGAECGNPLICAPKRSAEEFVAEDWVSVAEAITGRMRELKLSQRDLAVHSNVSVATIREIQRHRIKRRRNPRTLESLSESLGWPRQHLDAVLNGRLPQDPAEPAGDDGDLRSRLDLLEQRLDTIADVMHRIDAKIDVIAGHWLGAAGHEPEAAGTSAGVPAARSGPSEPGS
jgi:transcriptional regulator with XRE-family HTH domain